MLGQDAGLRLHLDGLDEVRTDEVPHLGQVLLAPHPGAVDQERQALRGRDSHLCREHN